MSDEPILPVCRPLRSRRVPIQLSLRRSTGSGSGSSAHSGSPRDEDSLVRRAVEATARAAAEAGWVAEERRSRAPSRRSSRHTPLQIAQAFDEAKMEPRVSLSRTASLSKRLTRSSAELKDLTQDALLERHTEELRQLREAHAKAEAELLARHEAELQRFQSLSKKRRTLTPEAAEALEHIR